MKLEAENSFGIDHSLSFFCAVMMGKKFKLAIFASGSGSNAEEIFKYFQHHPSIEIVLLMSNNSQAYALERAKKYSVTTMVFDKPNYREGKIVLDKLRTHHVTHIVLAGFLWLIPDYLIQHFPHKIINIHPALLPKFGGKGMYGMKVHESVKLQGEMETGITIHEVNENYDEGKIIFQASCALSTEDSPDAIAQKVHTLEYKHYPAVIEQWVLKG